MTENAKQAWGEVGEKFTSWGRQVADRYRGSGAKGNQLTRGFSALSDTFRDGEARHELTDAVSSIGDAITATVDETAGAIRSGSGKAKDVPPRADDPPHDDTPEEA